jgi:hypothetical protein
VSPVRYELGFYIPEDGILHSHHRENLKSKKKLWEIYRIAYTRISGIGQKQGESMK